MLQTHDERQANVYTLQVFAINVFYNTLSSVWLEYGTFAIRMLTHDPSRNLS